MMNNKFRAFICGVKGKKLTKNEIFFLKKYKPWGIILFSRNISTISQTQKLTTSIKKIFSNKNYPILIDEEGGRVSRLNKFIDNSIFSAKFFGELYRKDKNKFNIYYDVYVKQISYLLKLLGININTVPVLDIHRSISNIIIGDRAYSKNSNIISNLGDICIKKFHENKVLTVIKHIPGHGLAKVDSHEKLPIINKEFSYLQKNDFIKLISSRSIIETNRKSIKAGSLIFDYVFLGYKVRIGFLSLINTGTYVGHEAKIEDYCIVGPNCTICGNVVIQSHVYIGAGSTIKDHVEICSNVLIGCGAVVTKNILKPGIYAGVPAKLIKDF